MNEIRRPLVLVADESKLTRVTATRTLRDLGYDAIEAASAEEAFAGIELHLPDAVLLDALIPQLHGRDLWQAVRNNHETQDTRVIVMTGPFKAPRYRYEAHNTNGVDDYLHKPVDPAELRAVLDRVLNGAPEVGFEIVA